MWTPTEISSEKGSEMKNNIFFPLPLVGSLPITFNHILVPSWLDADVPMDGFLHVVL